MNPKVLFVDDDANLLASLKRNLRQRFELETATGGEEGLAKIKSNGPFEVVVSDRQMPGMDGVQFLSLVRRQSPDTIRVMLTGNVDLEQAVRAVNEGNIFRFLIKPSSTEVLSRAVEDAAAQHRLVVAEKELLNKTLNGSIKLLTDILSLVDTKSFGRAEKLRALITQVAPKISLGDSWEIHLAAMLSPIGYVTLPQETLAKARAGQTLSKAEQGLFNNVPEIAARLLSNIPRLEGVAKIAQYQHKHFDGGGVPVDDIKGELIPTGARLLKILGDLLDLQATGKSQSEALDDLARRSGIYDPQLLFTIRSALGAEQEKTDSLDTVFIGINDLSVGMILHSDIVTNDGMMVLSAGHYVNQTTLEKIQNFNLIYGIKGPIYVKAPHAA